MIKILMVAAGGALGSVLRYLTALSFPSNDFPYGILTVNVIGCFLAGILARFAQADLIGQNASALLITGFLGGFTTYSAFASDTLKLFKSGDVLIAGIYIAATTVLALCAVWLGFWACGIFSRNLR